MSPIGEVARRAPPRPLLAPLRKQCSSCKRTWLYDHFGRDWRASDGLRSQCRHCERAAMRERYRRNSEARVG